MKHATKARLWQSALIVLAPGCAAADPDSAFDDDFATTAEAVVSGWTGWSTSSKWNDGGRVGCHNGSLVSAIERSGSKTRIHCTPVADAANTSSFWTSDAGNRSGEDCPSTYWVTGYQSLSWQQGSGFRLQCSRTPDLATSFCTTTWATAQSGQTWFHQGYYMKGGMCGDTCANLKWTSCGVSEPRNVPM
jgi:hypothetical protein